MDGEPRGKPACRTNRKSRTGKVANQNHLSRAPDLQRFMVWSAKDVNQRKADRLAHEAGLKPLTVPRGPKELLVTALRNAHSVAAWKLFLKE